MIYKNDYLVDTGILIEHICCVEGKRSALEIVMLKNVCYTTVLNASALFFTIGNESEKTIVRNLLNALKVLGTPAKYSLYINDFIGKVSNLNEALFCVTAKLNKLTVLTLDKNKYINTGLSIIDAGDIA